MDKYRRKKRIRKKYNKIKDKVLAVLKLKALLGGQLGKFRSLPLLCNGVTEAVSPCFAIWGCAFQESDVFHSFRGHSFSRAGNWTWAPVHARQEFYHWATAHRFLGWCCLCWTSLYFEVMETAILFVKCAFYHRFFWSVLLFVRVMLGSRFSSCGHYHEIFSEWVP